MPITLVPGRLTSSYQDEEVEKLERLLVEAISYLDEVLMDPECRHLLPNFLDHPTVAKYRKKRKHGLKKEEL